MDDCDQGSQCDRPPVEETRSTPEKWGAARVAAVGLRRKLDKRCQTGVEPAENVRTVELP